MHLRPIYIYNISSDIFINFLFWVYHTLANATCIHVYMARSFIDKNAYGKSDKYKSYDLT